MGNQVMLLGCLTHDGQSPRTIIVRQPLSAYSVTTDLKSREPPPAHPKAYAPQPTPVVRTDTESFKTCRAQKDSYRRLNPAASQRQLLLARETAKAQVASIAKNG